MNAKMKEVIVTRISVDKPFIYFSPNTYDNAAPNPAAEDIPKVYGLARGLFNMFCICNPEIARDAPTNIDIKTHGILNSQIISLKI